MFTYSKKIYFLQRIFSTVDVIHDLNLRFLLVLEHRIFTGIPHDHESFKPSPLQEYKRQCEKFKPVFRHYFTGNFHNPAEWYKQKCNYTYSLATSSIGQFAFLITFSLSILSRLGVEFRLQSANHLSGRLLISCSSKNLFPNYKFPKSTN